MKKTFQFIALVFVLAGSASGVVLAQDAGEQVGVSPWGPDDEIGTLNMMTDNIRLEILSRISSGKVYDLSVEFFVGMPSFYGRGDPRFHYALTHTPRGNAVDDPTAIGQEMNEKIIYTGDVVSMYTHMGTHVDALNHFGLNGRIYNGFSADEHLGDLGWHKTGAETIPPVVARGVLIDVAAAKGLDVLPDAYPITARDLEEALEGQKTQLHGGEVVLIRTGRMGYYYDAEKYMNNSPGLVLGAAKWLVEEKGAMMLGADTLSFEIRLHRWLLEVPWRQRRPYETPGDSNQIKGPGEAAFACGETRRSGSSWRNTSLALGVEKTKKRRNETSGVSRSAPS